MSIMYGCDRCASVDPERCAFHERSELRVVGDAWLCEHCFDFRAEFGEPLDEPINERYWKDFPAPEEYGPQNKLTGFIASLREELAELRDDKHNWIGAGMPAAISGYLSRAERAERALLEIAHLQDDADLHEAVLIALRALPEACTLSSHQLSPTENTETLP